MKVDFTQFHLPNGRQTQETCEIPDDLADQYTAIQKAGMRLTAEVLSTGRVSLCIEHPEGDFDCRIATNAPGPKQPDKVLAEMIRAFDAAKAEEWVESFDED